MELIHYKEPAVVLVFLLVKLMKKSALQEQEGHLVFRLS